ncbi:MAG: sugar ABC transporter substrate-binding protein [Pseudomonadota bacterium]|nr:sugar ABC transporter substrate-binding protein [Pseudomonadota bacterium]
MNRKMALGAAIAAACWMAFAPGAATAQQKTLIAAVFANQTNQAWIATAEGVRGEAAKRGYDLLLTDARDNIAKQLSDAEDAITRGAKFILLIGVDQGAAQIIRNANERKVPVINIMRNYPGDVVSYIGVDNTRVGEGMIEWWAKQLNGRAAETMVITGTPGAASSVEREKGLDKELAKHPNIKIVARQAGFYDRAKTLPVAENILQGNPKAEAIIGFNDEIAMGALAAAKAQNRKLIITGTDGNKDALQAIKNGDLTMSIVFDLREAGRLAVEAADKTLKGQPVEKRVDLPMFFVTKENVDTFIR